MVSAHTHKWLEVLVRVGIFVTTAILGLSLFPYVTISLSNYFVGAVMATFAAGAVANVIPLRIFEHGALADVGLNWSEQSQRNLVVGLVGGLGAGLAVVLLPVIVRAADLKIDPAQRGSWASLLFITIVLLFGAIGEELLFRGYGFQVLVRFLGPFATILPVSVLFGFAHINNQNVTFLAIVNTVAWGILLGYAFLRSGDLWLPLGLHFGWNWTLPLLGVNLSGFTMGVTGFVMHWRAGDLWSGGAYGPEGGLLTTGVVIALFFFLNKAPVQPQNPHLLESNSHEIA